MRSQKVLKSVILLFQVFQLINCQSWISQTQTEQIDEEEFSITLEKPELTTNEKSEEGDIENEEITVKAADHERIFRKLENKTSAA